MRELAARLRAAHAEATMTGWDFSRLDGRLRADDPPWDFEADCRTALGASRTAADLGTGGGERLLALLAGLPTGRAPAEPGQQRPTVTATEGWEPNLPVAGAALAPAGVEVLAYDSEAGELREWFGGAPLHPEVRLPIMVAELAAAGLTVDRAEDWAGTMEFRDAEALVEYLGLVPWDVPGFAVDDHLETLVRLDAAPIQVTQKRFRVTAHRPPAYHGA
ncbi:SAM-dependent methyltransferase [Brevibacterium sp. CS2]|uniref:SAM-dependent methyltransferase n=1 Tax=Brevibacterium sp. CS2 TaxID=2575923 RepID=UPI0010C7782C|nr:SAM-dependent methyltransferase [Brevibacterium sp. CS2]QCP05303.1 SAM-dependent methyltransferase [Brevibacterium sp. CS2]